MWALVKYGGGSGATEKARRFDVDLCDAQGHVCVQLKGLEMQEYLGRALGENVPDPKTQDPCELLTFEESWQEQALPEALSAAPKVIVCFLSNPDHQQAFARIIQTAERDCQVIFIAQDTRYQKLSQQGYLVDRKERATYEEALRSVGEDYGTADALLYMWAIEDSSCIRDYSCIFYLLQATASVPLKPKQLVLAAWFESALEQCYLESWIGFERSLGLVLPNTKIMTLLQKISQQNPNNPSNDWLPQIAAELQIPQTRSVLYQKGKRYIKTIHPITLPSGKSKIREGATYLITGGCGGLGFLFAEHIAKIQPVNLILTGRSELNEGQKSKIKRLTDSGSRIRYLQADVCDAERMKEELLKVKADFGTILGVIHAAGVRGGDGILERDVQDFIAVSDPKIKGTLLLDEILKEEDLEFICYFSSAAAILGDFGSCDYAVGNRFQMAYATYRHLLQLPGKAVAINWPLWRDGGMGFAEAETAKMYLKSSGQRYLEAEEGTLMFDRILAQDQTQCLVLAGQPGRVRRFLGLDGEPCPALAPAALGALGKGRRVEMKGLSLAQCVEWDLKEQISNLLKISREQLDIEENLADFGFDSISLAEFANALTNHYGIEITPALFFGYATIQKLTQYFLTQHQATLREFYREAVLSLAGLENVSSVTAYFKRQTGASRFRTTVRRQNPPEPIAIIGMSGRFPGTRNIDEMWQILFQGRDVIGEIPAERFDWRQYYGDPAKEPGKTNCKWCGCIPGVSEFDPMFFEISPREAISMDPRQRLLLQEAWNALEDAGYGAKQIRSGKMGMFVGVEEGDYHLLAPAKASITSNHNAILASRLAYFLDLDGPVMALNTTCSSGLVAAHQACLSLRNRECDTAIAAGVSLLLAPDSLINMAQAGMLSGDGKCYTFDRRANGMVPGEAVAVVVFKRLAQAESDGDPIYAIIQGSGVNYDGKTNGITAPSGGAQTKLLKSVYDQCRVNPEDIEYIVTHGTGTKLGDPVEINALYDAFKSYTEKRNYCALTSTKPNFGHAFAASGIVGLISLVQAFRYETIPASLHCERENTYINWQESPFYVNKTRQPWPERSGKTRTGAISAFGMNGTNVHMVLNSYPPKAGGAFHEPAPYYLLALSAKSKEALQEKVKAIVALLQIREWPEADLSRLSYTLLEGRQHFNFRCAVVFQGRDDVVYALTQVDKKEKLFNLFEGEVPRNFTGQKAMQEYLVDLIKQCRRMQNDREKYREKLYAVADLYRQGYEIPWDQMYERVKPCRMHLPTYPFTRDNYWVSKGKSPVYSSLESSGSHMRPASGGGELISAMACGKPREIGLTTVSAGLPPVSKPVEKVRQPITLTAVGANLASPQSVAEPETQPCLRPIITAEALREELSLSLADALFIERGAVDVDRKFIDLGLDSIIGVEWVRAINQQYGTAILATKVYDYPSVREFAGFMEKELAGLGAGLSPTARGCTPAPKRVEQARQPIALTATDVDLAPSQSVAEPETQPCLRPIITAEALREELSLSLADALFIERGAVDVDQKFIDMGLDSIIGVEWVRAINQQYGTAILATKVYDYPSVREFAGFMAKELAALGDGLTQRLFGPQDSGASQTRRVHSGEAGTENPKAQGPDLTPDARVLNQENSVRLPSIEAGLFQRKPLVSEEPPLKTADDKEAIAIIGMSGRYPDASNLEQYWNNLAQGKNAIREIPDSRWDVNQYYDPRPYQKGKIYCKWLGLLEDIDQFDPLFFNIAPTEAELMDPQHRLFLQEGYKAFEDAGYNCKALSNQKCGVYMGIMSHEYGLILYRNRIGGANTTGNSHAIGAARLPYFLNLKGPAIPIDTACSSSLVAIHLACRALLNREINMALAGGVSVYLTPEPYLGMCAAGMLSAAGQCKTFDNSADGFVPGEGAGTLLLKRLKDAEADRDLIHGVIIGSGINQDGKTNGITAPSVNSQSELEREIYSQNRIHPESISYVEMHGTGTKLGDPIELEALATVFKERTDRKQYCAIGSVKSNIGHTSAAAGMASVQKVLLCMKHQKLVPTLNFQNPNEHFDFENSPFYVNTELKPWEVSSGNSRRAGVNSLGFSGTNAHLVIEEYHPKPNCGAMPRVINQDNPILFVLSAQSEPQLKTYAKSMKSFIESHAGLNLADMAYTLQMGREEFEYRLAFPANSKETLLNALEGYIGNRPPAGVLVNRVKKNNKGVAFFESDEDVKVLLQNWIKKKKFKKLLELWVIGMSLDWNQLYQQAAPRRISLPTYPFAKERYWIPVNPANWKPNLSAAITEANPVTLNPANLESVMLQKDWRGAVIPA
ncbi:MAG: SDR family NAD(P)-dependent oxidoreductase, partial [Bacillota bacterium]